MKIFNYSSIKRRDKKVYSIFNATVSQQGLGMFTVKVSAMFLALFTVFGLIFCWVTGTFWYSPLALAHGTSAGYFYLAFVFAPIGLGVGMSNWKIQNYRAIIYLKMYFSPKKAINHDNKKVKIHGYRLKSFIEHIK